MTRRRGRPHSSGHDDVVARLRAADPAASLPPLDPARVARLREDAMTDTSTAPEASPVTSARRPLVALAAAAAVAVAAGAIWQLGGAQDPAPTAGSDPAVTPEETVTALSLPEQAPGRCMVPSAELLAGQEVAFGGVVTADADGLVTLEVDRWFAGDETDLVTVAEPSAEMQAAVLAVDFEVGQRYLVSARDGRVALCGMSGPETPELDTLYAEAWPSTSPRT